MRSGTANRRGAFIAQPHWGAKRCALPGNACRSCLGKCLGIDGFVVPSFCESVAIMISETRAARSIYAAAIVLLMISAAVLPVQAAPSQISFEQSADSIE